MIDKRLGYVAAISLTAAAATAIVLTPRDSISLALGMNRASLPADEQIAVPAAYRSEVDAGIAAEWFRPNRCSYGNGLLTVALGSARVSISPLDVERVQMRWSETWTQDHSGDVILHKASGCADRPLEAQALLTKPLGSFDNGIQLWPAKASKREIDSYVSQLADLRTGLACYVDQGLRLCQDPSATDRDSGASFYVFTDDAARVLPSGAPWNLRCHAATGRFDVAHPTPLSDVECQIADLATTGFNYAAKVYDGAMMNSQRFNRLNTEMRDRLATLR